MFYLFYSIVIVFGVGLLIIFMGVGVMIDFGFLFVNFKMLLFGVVV